MPPQVRGAAAGAKPFDRVREALREPDRGARRVLRLAAERLGDAPGAVRVVERELPEHAGTEHRDVLPALARSGRDSVDVEERTDVDALEALGGEPEDSARAAILLAQSFPTAIDGLGAGRSAENLRRHGLEADVERCARENDLDVVPRYVRRVGPAAEVTV